MNSVLCKRFWHIFNVHLHHLLLMMESDCPFAFRHKKGEYIWTLVEDFLLLGGEFLLLELVEFRLYLGASLCMYPFWLLKYCF